MISFKMFIKTLLEMIYPNRCVGCGEIIPEGEGFCHYCFEMLRKTNEDKRCRVCGNPKDSCFCKYKAFHFTGATAPFYNENPAKQAFYDFKFREKPFCADFFAEQMALKVKTDFYNAHFTAVVYVPMTLRREIKRGYNQSYELAKRVAKILDIPLVTNALGCNKKRRVQHKTPFKERFQNVKGMYYPNISLKGQSVLLVDDIKTTGATLDECARALLKAGAVDVYCVTALMARYKKKDKKKAG